MGQYDNGMRRQVYSLPALVRGQYQDLEPKARKVLSFQEIFNIQGILLTGCGDSYGACMATKHMFERLTNIPTQAVTALELGRFYQEGQLGTGSRNPLVVAVSHSGQVARVTEAARRAKAHGCFVLGITGDLASPLALAADKVFHLEVPDFESAPGTRTYEASLMALLLLAIRIGEVKGRYSMDQAMAYRQDMEGQGTLLEAFLPAMDQAVEQLAMRWKDLPCFDFVGAGFDYAAAWFGQAKMLEAAGRWSLHVNSEEWFHLNCFAASPAQIGTLVVANTANPGLGRTKDVVHYAKLLGRPLAVITDGRAEDFGEEGQEGMEGIALIQVPRPRYPIHMPLTQFAPLCLLAGYVCAMAGETYARGSKGPWSFCENGFCVRNNEILVM